MDLEAKEYKWDAQDYSKNSEAQRNWAMELINQLQLKGNESVLDIGCGDGRITSEIARIVTRGNVIGIDSSEEMINLASNKYPPSQHSNLYFELIDAQKIPYVNQFDVIFSNAALHWVKDHNKVMHGITTALKTNGRILLQMGGKGNASDILTFFDDLMNEDKWNKYFAEFNFTYSFLDITDYESLLHQYNLTANQIELIPKDMKQIGKEGLDGWIRTTWLPYLEKIPEELKEQFISEIVERYIEKFPLDEAGFAHDRMMRLQVSAIKK